MTTNENTQKTVPMKAIRVSDDQNTRHGLPKIKEMAASIERQGLLQPLVVSNGGDEKHPYTLVAGFRRFAALKELGWKDVPVTVRAYKEASPIERIFDNIAENEDREDVYFLDIAEKAHQLVTGTYPVEAGEEAVPVEKKIVAERRGWGTQHLNNLLRVFAGIDADVARKCRKAEVPLRYLLKWAAIEGKSTLKGKGHEESEHIASAMADKADKQMAAYSEWEKAQAEPKPKRGSKKKASASEDAGVLKPTRTIETKERGDETVKRTVEDYVAVITFKQSDANKEEAARLQGALDAFRFLTGEVGRFPGVTEADFKALERFIAKSEDKAAKKDEAAE